MKQDLPAFRPHPLVRGGHLQTLLPALLFKVKKWPGDKVHHVTLPDQDRIVLLENTGCSERKRDEVVLIVHGLGTSVHEPGVVRQAERLQKAGFDVFRMNHRGIAEGRSLSRGIYHGDRMGDIATAVEYLVENEQKKNVVVVAHSMSANMLLKLLGYTVKDGWPYLKNITQAVCLCPTLDMKAAAAAIKRSLGGLYNHTYVSSSLRYLRDRSNHFSGVRGAKDYRTMVQMDQDYICVEAGYETAEAYYEGCSPIKWLPKITRPCYVLCAADDPVAANAVDSLQGLRNEKVQVHITPSGGHLGYLARRPGSLGFQTWLDDWVEKVVAANPCTGE